VSDMIAAVMGIGRYIGAETVLIINILVFVTTLLVSTRFRCCITHCLVVLAATCDVVIVYLLYPCGIYRNNGIGTLFFVAIYPTALLLMTVWSLVFSDRVSKKTR